MAPRLTKVTQMLKYAASVLNESVTAQLQSICPRPVPVCSIVSVMTRLQTGHGRGKCRVIPTTSLSSGGTNIPRGRALTVRSRQHQR